ncbi:MAG: transcriptional regulator [Candidatus Cloacimonadota bacterium]|nr:MAG: transcriptional regulator [Candidatus Cloacimonadota bacterium]
MKLKGGNVELGNRLKEWRAKKDITQEELAIRINMSRQSINAIERGRFVPSILTALKMANFFETKIENLFYIK